MNRRLTVSPPGRADGRGAAAGPTDRWRWPAPALAAWGLAWALHLAALACGAPGGVGVAGGVVVGAGLAWRQPTRLRRMVIAAGFPASLLASGVSLPAWAWLLPLAALAGLYPMRAWRDAPLFPTPAGALDALPAQVQLPPGARVLDAGCGLGHGLRALRRAWPQARVEGVESSLPLAWWTRWRCRFAQVRRGDLWAGSWSGYALVYLFQRPESMGRAWAKARAEMAPGAWLVSLEFAAEPAEGDEAPRVLRCADGRPLWLYRVPPRTARRGDSSPRPAGR